ncbi:MAG: hypothetical protein P1Q69_02025 [Candidatus Thorarchaeota archaeon]|nr:hypothetical protein [Candidatus Thorarchaeota archaeon]
MEEESEILLKLLDINLGHSQHATNERNWFTGSFLIITAALIAYVASSPPIIFSPFLIYALLFLFTISLLGLVVTMRLSNEISKHWKCIEEIMEHKKLKPFSDYMHIPATTGRWKYLRVRMAYYGMYVSFMIMWAVLSIWSVIQLIAL